MSLAWLCMAVASDLKQIAVRVCIHGPVDTAGAGPSRGWQLGPINMQMIDVLTFSIMMAVANTNERTEVGIAALINEGLCNRWRRDGLDGVVPLRDPLIFHA